eukprot:scaffold106817_cov51-Attheya_sp.AAC.1
MPCSFCGVCAVDGASFDGNNERGSCGPNEERTSQSHTENWMMVCDTKEIRGNHPCPHGWCAHHNKYACLKIFYLSFSLSVAYCNSECQKAHSKDHEKMCPKLLERQREESHNQGQQGEEEQQDESSTSNVEGSRRLLSPTSVDVPFSKRPRIESLDHDWSKMSDSSSILSAASYDFSSEDDDEDDSLQNSTHQLKRAFDANKIVDSIERGEPVLNCVDGRDVVLVVGKTGTGKTTLIQAISGRTLTETTHTCRIPNGGGDEAIKVVYETAGDALPGFEIGHAKTSRTACINCFDPNEEKRTIDDDKSALVYVDSPGFQDTNGHEVDIATSVMLSEVAKRCRSLRFVILISYVSLLEDRGGAMRSVLKLVRNFVKDFKEERRSFMFLFTHTNEIKGIPDDVDGAKACLLNELILTKEGTTDEETRQVLEFIYKSLKKGFPFANVFLPLKTDATELVDAITKKMKTAANPHHLASNCGLTLDSRLRLSGELQGQLNQLRWEVRSDAPDMERIKEWTKLFRYFGCYVSGVGDVRTAVLDADNEIKNYIKEQISLIDAELSRGILSDHDFGDANVADIQIKLTRLR